MGLELQPIALIAGLCCRNVHMHYRTAYSWVFINIQPSKHLKINRQILFGY